jgi:hypothetical protein
MKKLLLAAALAATAVFAAPAQAIPPTRTDAAQQVTLTNPTACGDYGVSWAIDLTVDITRHFDSEGRLVRIVQRITEDNTVTNTVTGLTLRDGPDNFTQTIVFDPLTGLADEIHISGLAVNVQRGSERLMDTGHIVIDAQTNLILESSGPHPVREAMNGSNNIRLALPAFCDILR